MDVDEPIDQGKQYKVWVPKQRYPSQLVDFRSEAMPDHLGPKGFTVEKQNERVKKGLLPQTWEDAEGKGKEVDVDPMLLRGERRNAVGVGKVSGKNWKEVKQPARAMKRADLKKPSLEEVRKEREFRKVAREQRAAAKARRAEILKAERERRQRVKAEKEARRKAAEVTQVVSTKTARRMMKSKKARKLLKTA